MFDQHFMQQAYLQAEAALAISEVPIGCVIVYQDRIIASAHNLVEKSNSAIAHAEILALQQASLVLESKYLIDCDLYVTLEPCSMCASAISFFKIRRLYFAAQDEKGGGVLHGSKIYQQTTCHHKPEIIIGIMQQKCSNLLKSFFFSLRNE